MTEEGPERFLVRMVGGPLPGTRVVENGEYAWPLPDVLRVSGGGVYRKVAESDLPAQSRGSRVVRGAEYEWVPEQFDPARLVSTD